jgi:hypothetical protein
MAEAPRLGQVTAEVTPEVKQKLGQLEAELVDYKARGYEIVGLLIKRASVKSIPPTALLKYRSELRTARAAAQTEESS